MVSGVWQVMFNPDGRLWIDRLAGGLEDGDQTMSAAACRDSTHLRHSQTGCCRIHPRRLRHQPHHDRRSSRNPAAGGYRPLRRTWARQAPEGSFEKVAIVHQAFRVQNVCTEMSKPGENVESEGVREYTRRLLPLEGHKNSAGKSIT